VGGFFSSTLGRYLFANTWLAHFVPAFLGITWVGAPRGCSWLRVFLFVDVYGACACQWVWVDIGLPLDFWCVFVRILFVLGCVAPRMLV